MKGDQGTSQHKKLKHKNDALAEQARAENSA